MSKGSLDHQHLLFYNDEDAFIFGEAEGVRKTDSWVGDDHHTCSFLVPWVLPAVASEQVSSRL